jgi:hypothetical protein
MSTSRETKNRNGTGRHGSNARRRPFSSGAATILAAIITAAGALIATIITVAFSSPSGNQPQSGAPLSSQPSSPTPSATRGEASSSASTSAPTSGPASTNKVLYRNRVFSLNGGRCDNTHNFPNVIFEQNGLIVTPSTPAPPSGAFGLVLYCSSTSSGSDFDPNISYGGRVAILSDRTDFSSCYSASANTEIQGSIPFDHLRMGTRLCILYGSELALVTLRSVSQTLFRLDGTVTVWRVLASN